PPVSGARPRKTPDFSRSASQKHSLILRRFANLRGVPGQNMAALIGWGLAPGPTEEQDNRP
ncbi:MAG: hypothetical protein KJN79_04965, partial [Gammaproteobacteria bacterium]|nr:hypothetical protein [Gammaproteobacteria bacterium]